MKPRNVNITAGKLIEKAGFVLFAVGKFVILLIRDVPLHACDKAQDKKIAKIAMELKDLAKKVDQMSFMQRLLHLWNFKRMLFGG